MFLDLMPPPIVFHLSNEIVFIGFCGSLNGHWNDISGDQPSSQRKSSLRNKVEKKIREGAQVFLPTKECVSVCEFSLVLDKLFQNDQSLLFFCITIYIARSPCQNGGTCVDNKGFSGHASCHCLDGFSGDYCEIDKDDCSSNPCSNGGNCTDIGPGFRCRCPVGFGGRFCSELLSWCNSNPCANGGTCYEKLDGFQCSCPPEYSGATCAFPTKSKSIFINEHNYNFLPHHKGFHHQGHEVLKITMKETIHNKDLLLNQSQIICFIILGLLTCLIVLITTGIVFFSKCETWLANAKYSQLIRKKKDFYMKASGESVNDVKIIFPEKVKMADYSRSYTTI